MSNITKRVNRLVPPTHRTQVFNQSDAVAGDILMIKDSLGHQASYIFIETTTGGNLAFQFNVLHTVFPPYDFNGQYIPFLDQVNHLPFLASGQTVQITTPEHQLAGVDYLLLEDSAGISDMYIMIESGNWQVTVA